MIMAGRRTSAAITANALMVRSALEDGVRPHTAGVLNGRKAIDRDEIFQALHSIGSNSQAEEEDQGQSIELNHSQLGSGHHIPTQHIMQEARVAAMQSGGYESKRLGGHGHDEMPPRSPIGLPALHSPGARAIPPTSPHHNNRPESAHQKQAPASREPFSAPPSPYCAGTNGLMSYSDEDLDGDNFDDQILFMDMNVQVNVNSRPSTANAAPTTTTTTDEGASHTPFQTRAESQPQRHGSILTSSLNMEESGKSNPRRGSLSLRGSLCIPMSTSYVDTLSRSTITPKSTMALKLEATIDKYIHKR